MKIARSVVAGLLLSLACAYGQTVIISAATKDPEIKPEQRNVAILHFEKMRSSARETLRTLALDLRSSDAGARAKVNEAMNNQQDTVEWANWCILALRDKTAEANACYVRTDLRQ
jgi:hypothetical protein